MSSVQMTSTLKLNYHRERFTYNMDWNIPFEVGAEHYNFLMKYSKLTQQKIFRSEKIFCTSGPLRGPGKYLEFFVLLKSDSYEAEIFTKMCYVETNDEDEDFESFEFLNVDTYLYDHASKKLDPFSLHTRSPSNINVGESTIPIQLKELDSDYPKEENSKVKWSKYAHGIQSVQRITRISFSVVVLLERWRKTSSSNNAHPSIPECRISPKQKPGHLNTSDLLFSSKLSDLKIYCGNCEFLAHIFILRYTSTVFDGMFSQPMLENLTRELTIEDAEPEIVEEFLRYIYTGTVTDMNKNSVGLFVMAEKYDVQNLKSFCEKFILANISVENVLDRYDLGKLQNSEAITSKCIQEIRKNRKTIWKTKDEFCEACQTNPELLFEIFYN